jgi:hypothetical protein
MTVHTALAAPTAWWQQQRNIFAVRAARRLLRREGHILALPRLLRAAMVDRAQCVACGDEHALNTDGRVRAHGHGCPGGGELPAPITGRTP